MPFFGILGPQRAEMTMKMTILTASAIAWLGDDNFPFLGCEHCWEAYNIIQDPYYIMLLGSERDGDVQIYL